jgi:hypothetical protein
MSALDPVLRVVRCNATDPDPALDMRPETVEQLVAYIRERDPAKLPLIEGTTPTWFSVRRLPAAYLSSVIEGIYPRAAQREHAVRAAVFRVECPGGEVLEVQSAKASPKAPFAGAEVAHGVCLAPESWSQELADRFGAEVLQELGEVALDSSRLPKGRRGPFSSWGGTVAGR